MVYIFNMPKLKPQKQPKRREWNRKNSGLPVMKKDPVLVAQLNNYHLFFSMLGAIPQRPVPK